MNAPAQNLSQSVRSTTQKLEQEMETACSAVRQEHLDALLSMGVSSAALATLGAKQCPFGFGRIHLLGGHYFGFAPDGHPCVVMPVMEAGAVIDIIAWQASKPQRWLWRAGGGDFLGRDLIGRSQWTAKHALAVVATPLDWLRAAGDAVCVLNWAAPRSELEQLRFVSHISVSDDGLAKRLGRVMAEPRPIPQISVGVISHA